MGRLGGAARREAAVSAMEVRVGGRGGRDAPRWEGTVGRSVGGGRGRRGTDRNYGRERFVKTARSPTPPEGPELIKNPRGI